MLDAVMLVMLIGLFLLVYGFISWCGRVAGDGEGEER
jgi:hypothetical protein